MSSVHIENLEQLQLAEDIEVSNLSRKIIEHFFPFDDEGDI